MSIVIFVEWLYCDLCVYLCFLFEAVRELLCVVSCVVYVCTTRKPVKFSPSLQLRVSSYNKFIMLTALAWKEVRGSVRDREGEGRGGYRNIGDGAVDEETYNKVKIEC